MQMVAVGTDISQPASEKTPGARNCTKWHKTARETAESNASYGRPKKSREGGGRIWRGARGRERPKRPQRGKIRTLPCAGIIQIRFKGYFSPATHGQSGDRLRCAAQDPRVSSRNNTPHRSVLATICNTHACVCIAYCIMATTVFSRMRCDIFIRRSCKLAAAPAGFSSRYRASARCCPTPFSASDMLSCLARFAATLKRHARRSSLPLVSGEAKPAVFSLPVWPADVAIIFVAE
jgi:hypothetical protein